jgi:hypothetical protein
MVKNIQNFREFNQNQDTDYIFESKLSDLYNRFNLKEIKKLLKEKLDIDENTPKLEIAKKILKFYYKLELKLLKYELGAILGSFIFYVLSIVLDIFEVEPFVTDKGQEPGMPHFILWAAGAILGIYKTYKKNTKLFEADKIFSDRDITNMYFTELGWIRYTDAHEDDYINIEKYFDINSYEIGDLLEELVEKCDLLYECSVRDEYGNGIESNEIPKCICIDFTPEKFEKVGGHKGINFKTHMSKYVKNGSLIKMLDSIESKLEDFYPHLTIKNKKSNFKGDMVPGLPFWFRYEFFMTSSQIQLKIEKI